MYATQWAAAHQANHPSSRSHDLFYMERHNTLEKFYSRKRDRATILLASFLDHRITAASTRGARIADSRLSPESDLFAEGSYTPAIVG